MNKKVVIIGAGGHAKVIADIVRASGDVVVGFLDDSYTEPKEFYRSRVIGKTSDYKEYVCGCSFVIAIGNGGVRKRISSELECEWYTAIHPSAVVSDSAKIGCGTVVMANAVINADAQIGEHVIINTGAIVEHDCQIGSYSHLSPRCAVCGVTKVGNSVWLGAGSTVMHVLSICDDVILGAGGVVVRNIEESGTYVGVPAEKIK